MGELLDFERLLSWLYFCLMLVSNRSVSSQSTTQQHYSTYDEAHLKPIMQHIAKNIVTVNEGKTKFQVRGSTKRTTTSNFDLSTN